MAIERMASSREITFFSKDMPLGSSHRPRPVPQVMVSSTFTDLHEHRAALIDAIHAHKLHANAMENDAARLVDVIESSLQMVRDSAAYIGVIGLKCGQTPESPTRNSDKLSITELEFNEAQRLGRPILLFIMGDDHPVKKADIERDPEKEKKLNTFRERAKKASPGSEVNRVYAVFNSLAEFKDKMGSSLAELNQHLDSDDRDITKDQVPTRDGTTIPQAPAFYAEPDYIGSHEFVGRDAELQALSDWAAKADPTNLLLFEAIGGNGKSMLTWEWTTKHATIVRSDWAGRFWYSFYERGAVMSDFCQRALAYMTGRRLGDFAKRKTAELKSELLAQLHARPWLLILDGLERVLVAYHRIDAAEFPDEEANTPTDKIVNRNPCDAIRDEDNDLLRALAAAAPSKILVSSRLTPRVLLNLSGQPINRVKRITLPGLRPPDAQKLLCSCGIEGKSEDIQSYLAANCDNHPLVIGILGGLIANYLRARGNFDVWSTAEDGGAALDLSRLDLIQRRNHILFAALEILPAASKQLLSTLALLNDSVDYKTLTAFNPHLPSKPQTEPESPEKNTIGNAARKQLEATVIDLEQRGLLQWNGREKRYDLHPVVRGVASSGLAVADREFHGMRVVDHFTAVAHNHEQAKTLEDLRVGLNVVRTLIKLGHLQQAVDFYYGGLARALRINLEAHAEILSILRPFFPSGWGKIPIGVRPWFSVYLTNIAGEALHPCGESGEALAAYGAGLPYRLACEDWENTNIRLRNIADCLSDQNMLAKTLCVNIFGQKISALYGNQDLFVSRLYLFSIQSRLGDWKKAEATWDLLKDMKRPKDRDFYLPGDAERKYAQFQYGKGTLTEAHLAMAERLAKEGKSRKVIRELHRLRGEWRLEQENWALAAESYHEAVRLARERSLLDAASETGLALAKHHIGQLADAHDEAERLALLRQPAHRQLAQFWLALSDAKQAKKYALAAYKWAWADGEPYVNRYELTKTTELLQQLNVPIPNLPPYDPAADEPLPWEAEIRKAIG